MIWGKLDWWKECGWLRWLWRVLVTWGFSVPGGVNGNQGTGSLAKYSQLFEMEIRLFQFRNQIRANIQGVSSLCSCPFEVAAKGGVLLPAWPGSHSACFHLYLAPAGLEWCYPSNQTVDVPRTWPPVSATPPPTPHDGLSWYRWPGDWFKMTVSNLCRKRRLIQRNSQANLLSL